MIGCESIGDIHGIEPSLGFENRFSIVSVKIQQGFQIRFVVVRVRLWTDESAIETNTDLLEERVSDVVDQEGVFGGHSIRIIGFL